MEEFARRVQLLAAEGAYFVLEKAKALEAEGKNIIHLEIGQPDFPTFENIAKAGIRAIENGHTRYTASAGTVELRRAIAEDASQRRNIKIEHKQVVVGPGAKPALFFPTLAIVEPGDEVIYPDPGFPTYRAMIEVAGGIPVPLPLSETLEFSFDIATLQKLITKRTKMIILNSPSNPTGGIIPQATLEKIAELAVENGIWILSDEIYSRLTFDEHAPSILSIPGMDQRTILCDGFSKTYSMTGWRLGYGIMPEGLAERVALLQTHSIGSTADFTQIAGVEALLGDQKQVENTLSVYRKRRDALVDGLNSIPGVTCKRPKGAFYVFPNVKSLGKTSDQIADYILENAGVGLLPGTSFGKNGEGYLRLCFANSLENIEQAVERLTKTLKYL